MGEWLHGTFLALLLAVGAAAIILVATDTPTALIALGIGSTVGLIATLPPVRKRVWRPWYAAVRGPRYAHRCVVALNAEQPNNCNCDRTDGHGCPVGQIGQPDYHVCASMVRHQLLDYLKKGQGILHNAALRTDDQIVGEMNDFHHLSQDAIRSHFGEDEALLFALEPADLAIDERSYPRHSPERMTYTRLVRLERLLQRFDAGELKSRIATGDIASRHQTPVSRMVHSALPRELLVAGIGALLGRLSDAALAWLWGALVLLALYHVVRHPAIWGWLAAASWRWIAVSLVGVVLTLGTIGISRHIVAAAAPLPKLTPRPVLRDQGNFVQAVNLSTNEAGVHLVAGDGDRLRIIIKVENVGTLTDPHVTVRGLTTIPEPGPLLTLTASMDDFITGLANGHDGPVMISSRSGQTISIGCIEGTGSLHHGMDTHDVLIKALLDGFSVGALAPQDFVEVSYVIHVAELSQLSASNAGTFRLCPS